MNINTTSSISNVTKGFKYKVYASFLLPGKAYDAFFSKIIGWIAHLFDDASYSASDFL